jgi:hypothetical protein
MCQSIFFFFFLFLSLSLSSISSFAHSFLLCLSVTCGVIYNSCVRPCLLHTHMEDDSFGPTLLSLFWFSK